MINLAGSGPVATPASPATKRLRPEFRDSLRALQCEILFQNLRNSQALWQPPIRPALEDWWRKASSMSGSIRVRSELEATLCYVRPGLIKKKKKKSLRVQKSDLSFNSSTGSSGNLASMSSRPAEGTQRNPAYHLRQGDCLKSQARLGYMGTSLKNNREKKQWQLSR